MSYTTIISVDPNRPPKELHRLPNAWGSAPVVWGYLAHTYFDTGLHDWRKVFDKVSKIHLDTSIPKYLRAVLLLTFDYAYVKKENLQRASKDINLFVNQLRSDFPDLPVNHWPEIAAYYANFIADERVAIHQTSVSRNPFIGEIDEVTGEYTSFDWSKAYEVYEVLDG